jgi:hypothetical protein
MLSTALGSVIKRRKCSLCPQGISEGQWGDPGPDLTSEISKCCKEEGEISLIQNKPFLL